MKTASASRTRVSKRSLFQRFARKWYAWAGLALTMTTSYLAIDGQLKFGSINLLQAAPTSAEVPWVAIPPSAVGPELAPEPKEVQVAAAEPARLPDEVRVPDVIPVPDDKVHPLQNTKVAEVLQSYVSGEYVVPASNTEKPAEGPKIPVPAVPVAKVPLIPVEEPARAAVPMPMVEPVEPMAMQPVTTIRPEAPKSLPPRALDEPMQTAQSQVPPVVPPDVRSTAPEGELIPSRPTPETSNNPALSAEVESLNSNQRLLYEAAQNAARMKDYARSSEIFEQLLKARPDLLYIRAEYAGIMVTGGELQRAVELYKRVIELKPDSMLYRIRLGDVYIIGKDYKAAIRIYSDAMRNPPFEPEYAVRLARAYTFDNDFNNAFQVYDKMLANIKPDDPRAPAAMGALLLDLDLPAEAMPYLLNKRKQLEREPRRRELIYLEVLCNLVRGYARLGERQAAMDVITELPAIAPDQIGIRETLAGQLYAIEEFELSAQVYNQVLQIDPNYGAAIIGLVRIYLDMAQPAMARQILDSFRPGPRQIRDYLSAYAVYHQRVGEYIEARQIYADMLRRNENDNQTRVNLGLLYTFYKDEWERGKAEFAKVPPQDRSGRQARREFADALVAQRKFQEALEIDRLLLAEDPTDYLTIAMATRHYAKAGMYEQGIALARGYLASGPRSEGHAVAVRLALGYALLHGNRPLDAVREYEILISRPSGRKVEAYYGLIRAHEKLGNAERAKQFQACIAGLPGGEFRNRLELVDLYMADYDDNSAIAICIGLLNQDPRHLPTLIRLGDAQQRQSRFSGQPADVFQTGQTILNMSSSNVRGHFQMARSFAVAQNFRKAAGQYDQLIKLDPEQVAPRLERARCLYADHQYSAARTSWEQLQRPSADEQLITNINDVISRNPKMAAFLQPYIIGGLAGPGLRKELGRLSTTVADSDLRLALHRLVCDYDARLARTNSIRLEQEAMEVKDYRQFTALNALKASGEFTPTNTETIYGLGQQYGAMRFNSREIDAYSQVLQVDPTHRDAMVASERSSAEMGPKLDMGYSYFSQLGRQGLAAIDREKGWVAGRIPLGDEVEFLQLGYMRAAYQGPFNNYPDTVGNIPFARIQKRFTDLLLGYAQVNVEEYNNGFKTRPTFDIGAIYQCCEWMWVRGGGNLENVVENGESIAQDIYRGGIYVGADFKPTRLWSFGGQYNYWRYSDDNDMNSFTLYNELVVTPPPKMLKLAQRMYFWGFRESTIFPVNPPNERNIFGAVHPYFSPNGYSQIEQRIEWYHWLSRDYFVHSNQCWYSLQYGIMTDNNLVTFHNLRAILNYDVCTWLTIGAQADAQLSSVYNMFTAQGFLQIRFR